MASVETSMSDTDGLLLRLARHPRAADDVEHMSRCVGSLAQALDVSEEEASRRIHSDGKFMEFWAALRILEAGSKEEAHVERSLRARIKILQDADSLARRVAPPVT